MRNSIVCLLFCFFASCSNIIIEKKDFEVKVDEWPGGYSSAISLSFDDNNWTLKKCQNIFDKYNYKCTFFINPGVWMSKPFLEDIKLAHIAGFEIGNHGSTHLKLDNKCTLDVLNKEIVNSKKELINITNQKYIYSFAAPFGYTDSINSGIISSNYLFVRDFVKNGKNIYHAPLEVFLKKYKRNIDSLLLRNSFIIVGGHGLDNCGYNPISSTVLDSLLFYLSKKNIWVDSFKNISAYYLVRENLKIDYSTSSIRVSAGNILVDKLKSIDIKSLYMNLTIVSNRKIMLIGRNAKVIFKDNKYCYQISVDMLKVNYINFIYDERD